MDEALTDLYSNDILTLSKDEESAEIAFDKAVFDKAAQWIYEQGEFTAAMLKEQPAKEVIRETYKILKKGISSAIKVEVPAELTAALENNAFVFSGFKTFHSLSEVGLKLTTDKGEIKPFTTFAKDVDTVQEKYNKNYLYAEYNHAVHSSQMAVKWRDFEADGDRYNLQYRTANDDKVRSEHALLHNTTLPPSDPFWDRYLPPNGWNCRCNVVQVRVDKYPASDSAGAIGIGDAMTDTPKKQMFRFNAGKTLELFPPKHPYYKAPKTVKEVAPDIAKEITAPEEVVEFINGSNKRKQWFARGFNSLIATTKRGVNGYTDMNGLIALTKERLDNVMSGLTKIRRGNDITFDEADSLATFWHEITHNRSIKGNTYLTTRQREHMELANELVSRNTLSEFYEACGGKLQHGDFQTDRKSTGYNTMVRNYCTIIKESGANFEGVIKDVKTHLFNCDYETQGDGLVKALKNNGAVKADHSKLKANEIKLLLRDCSYYREESFMELVKKSLGK